ncbi:hypothetical protein A5756_10930 [Mycobacterium sp. 852002-53434_SCH5985345]|uniref:LOG family protein n=1 Tax=unclassified Mycobacterium TaxID=2642494 RepID=UPI000800A3FB|nr:MULTISPECIES: LOG family protein [unclassified Mycobacterium]OBF56590.1 hypothetical protein A5756_10930 [Mycobacterium sp. 852002-53434_SCH5985345]OBF72192.1 hypothetical protein A5750_17825 [Mycobacterium sp. 852002-51613_SCH5001154]
MAKQPIDVPFQPIRYELYTSMELMAGYDITKPDSMASTLDFRSYRYFIANGGAAHTDPYAGMIEALHDNSIMQAMTRLLEAVDRPTVAIMGGHDASRDAPNYAHVVEISRRLTNSGCFVASGGGPGAMEATHLGALFAPASDDQVTHALQQLRSVPELPASAKVVGASGEIDMAIVRELHAWARPAFELAEAQIGNGGQSLAVPTWYYGNEPITPFATSVAKYFQNSIREDVLLSLAANGIIYTPGTAGTLQEVFQDARQNYYLTHPEQFAPMVFFGEDYWTNVLPVRPVLQALFVNKMGMSLSDFDRLVAIVDTVDDAVDTLLGHAPSKAKTAHRMEALGFGPMMTLARQPR